MLQARYHGRQSFNKREKKSGTNLRGRKDEKFSENAQRTADKFL